MKLLILTLVLMSLYTANSSFLWNSIYTVTPESNDPNCCLPASDITISYSSNPIDGADDYLSGYWASSPGCDALGLSGQDIGYDADDHLLEIVYDIGIINMTMTTDFVSTTLKTQTNGTTCTAKLSKKEDSDWNGVTISNFAPSQNSSSKCCFPESVIIINSDSQVNGTWQQSDACKAMNRTGELTNVRLFWKNLNHFQFNVDSIYEPGFSVLEFDQWNQTFTSFYFIPDEDDQGDLINCEGVVSRSKSTIYI